MNTCYIQSFKIQASFCSWAGWFESYRSNIPEDMFSCDVAQYAQTILKFSDKQHYVNSVDP